jgi:N-acyl-D-amino-acid deacylase
MLLLPLALAAPGTSKLAAAIATPEGRAQVRAAILERVLARPDLGEGWAEQITLSHVPAPRYHSLRGVTLAAAAHAEGTDLASLALDVLCACELQVTAIMRVPHPHVPAELAPLYRLPMYSAGSDGILVSAQPHPRAYGTFGAGLTRPRTCRQRGRVVPPRCARSRRNWRGCRPHRARFRTGVCVLDVRKPMQLVVGIDDVLVAGVPVLPRGELTGVTPGRGLRRC